MAEEVRQFPEEETHLKQIEGVLDQELEKSRSAISRAVKNYEETQKERMDNYHDMDGREHLQMERILKDLDSGIVLLEKAEGRLLKLQDSPYFARIDFIEEQIENPEFPEDFEKRGETAYYIGRFGFEHEKQLLIYDWRAPVSSMFYDHDTGEAFYEAPMGRISGRMTLKRQFRIKKGKLDYVLDNSQTVSDDILQQELSQTSDDRMKTIIATIQKEQNVVIRNEKARTMIIQGAAGSGKTSIALHRIAFLLYRFRNTVKAEDILILSPTKVFSDFISDVIPELGEEPVRETDFYGIAMDALDDIIDFDDPADPLDEKDPYKTERDRFKSTTAFLELLKDYAAKLPERIFTAKDYSYDGTVIEGEWIKEQFLFYKNDPVITRLPTIAEEVVEEMLVRRGLRQDLPKKGTVLQKLKGMLSLKNPLAVYRDFYRYIGREDMLYVKKSRLEWADVFPFLFLFHAYHGLDRLLYIKHLVVDEMQDYTPVQYAVLNIMYPCAKTILGDYGQQYDPTNPTTLADLSSLYEDAVNVRLNKSYRSTYEIMSFAGSISPQPELELLDRHGKAPEVRVFNKKEAEDDFSLNTMLNFNKSGYASCGIILPSEKQAASYYEAFKEKFPGLQLISQESTKFKSGISVTSVRMAKGLEFDQVLIPYADSEHYSRESDRSLLYIACTRAMHELTLTASGTLSSFIPQPRS